MLKSKSKVFTILWSSLLALLAVLVFHQRVNAQSVNDYIEQNNIQPTNIQRVAGTFDQWFGYRNGVGKPEGVVIHETATPGATAWNEVTYFNREWRNAQTYVHAFADANNILQIHDTDYGVWGAGLWANQRFIQIELCRETTWDNFARSVNNQAYFAAYMLNKYGLKPSLADNTGSGTIWSHDAVNKYHPSAGMHTDPIGYFNQWGYSMQQLFDLIQYHYNKLHGDPGNPAAGSADNGSNADQGIVRVNSNIPYTQLYTEQADGSLTPIDSWVLLKNTDWLTNKTMDYNGHRYYRVSTHAWAIDSDVHITKPIPNQK
ncbi:peptidoglycan recognition protein family protein [Bombilactobacillus thymidiniphilus]|uniref:Peptidoglycan recognition protein family protein n=1 Tax=Bombilactobacillus thymidiniphilus TaxID=2923363 RepID=A0ABY4PBX3_9LACO|nr:peptidoglycan recognition family protein [Bombilactobacillus thymidiniphilus]UQS83144.1 peptidoglycan recognition protein family protein [Bombilactobacillus thymidiniphilus]